MMPVGQAAPDDGMPPLVGAAKNIKFSRKENLWELGNVEEKSNTAQEVHDNYPREKNSDFIIVDTTIHDDPMNGRHTAPHHEEDKVHKSGHLVLLLVKMIPGQGSEQDEASDSGQVESAPGR